MSKDELPEARLQRTARKQFWITNVEFAKTNQAFRFACEVAGIEPTERQASKYRRKTGLAYKNIAKNKNKSQE